MLNKRLLQFRAPKASEPLCSGSELKLEQEQRIDLAHFHTVVTIIATHPRALLFGASADIALACTATINGREYEKQQLIVTRQDIGKTLFCAGFPCVTLISLDEKSGTVRMTLSEIVEPCEPGTCPWGDD
jgi:hypothetical protein